MGVNSLAHAEREKRSLSPQNGKPRHSAAGLRFSQQTLPHSSVRLLGLFQRKLYPWHYLVGGDFEAYEGQVSLPSPPTELVLG